jgi:hypothetical protein
MTIHPNDNPTPITRSQFKRRASEMAIASTLLAVAVMLGIGITAFSSLPSGSVTQVTTAGQGTR